MSVRTSRRVPGFIVFALVAAAGAAFAQTTTATLAGTVTDARGAVLPGAQVGFRFEF